MQIKPGHQEARPVYVAADVNLWNAYVELVANREQFIRGQLFNLSARLQPLVNWLRNVSDALESTADGTVPLIVDGYIWVDVPGGGRFFLMPDFTNFTDVSMPVVTSLPVQDFAGTILNMPIPVDLSAGTYTFFAIGVVPGTDPFNSANWVTNRAELSVTLTQ